MKGTERHTLNSSVELNSRGRASGWVSHPTDDVWPLWVHSQKWPDVSEERYDKIMIK